MSQAGQGMNIKRCNEINVALITRLIHKAKICSRADLAAASGLKQATITNIIKFLIDSGIVQETGYIKGRMDKRSVGLTLNCNLHAIGVRLNREYIMVGLFDIMGNLLCKHEKYFDRKVSPDQHITYMNRYIHTLLDGDTTGKVLGIGVAIPGPFMPQKGTIEFLSDYPGWESLNIAEELTREFSLPVFTEHDANCGALSEYWFGDIGEHRNMIFISASLGIGAGIILDGRLYQGSQGIAGEIGFMSVDFGGPLHDCGSHGCLEDYCSTKALREAYKLEAVCLPEYKDKADYNSEMILKEVAAGDPLARRVFSRLVYMLGVGITNLIYLFNPDLIIISDELSLAGNYLIQELTKYLEGHMLPSLARGVELRLAKQDLDSSFLGANAIFWENFFMHPGYYM